MSNAFRDFTVVRRRPNFVDLLIPKKANVQGYRLLAASNFDGTFSTLLTADISSGYLDPKVNPNLLHAVNATDRIRVVFDPASFSLTDSDHFWLKYQPIDFSGTPGTAGAPSLILPDDELRATIRVLISGTAPSAVNVASSLVLNLPYRMQDVEVRNNEASGGRTLFLATSEGGAERQVAPQETALFRDGAQGCLLVRGGGGTVSFSADFTHYLPL